MDDKKPLYAECDIKVKGYDIDAMGYVSNLVYVRWFEDLRTLCIEKYFPFDAMMRADMSPVIAKTVIEYKRPLTIYDAPGGRAWVEKIGATKWTMRLEIFSKDGIHCAGSQTGYLINLKTGRPARIPAEMAKAYEDDMNG